MLFIRCVGGLLRERRELLPGVTTLARLVASVRDAANRRLWDVLRELLSSEHQAELDRLLVPSVPDDARPGDPVVERCP